MAVHGHVQVPRRGGQARHGYRLGPARAGWMPRRHDPSSRLPNHDRTPAVDGDLGHRSRVAGSDSHLGSLQAPPSTRQEAITRVPVDERCFQTTVASPFAAAATCGSSALTPAGDRACGGVQAVDATGAADGRALTGMVVVLIDVTSAAAAAATTHARAPVRSCRLARPFCAPAGKSPFRLGVIATLRSDLRSNNRRVTYVHGMANPRPQVPSTYAATSTGVTSQWSRLTDPLAKVPNLTIMVATANLTARSTGVFHFDDDRRRCAYGLST